MLCGTLRFRGTLFEKQCFRLCSNNTDMLRENKNSEGEFHGLFLDASTPCISQMPVSTRYSALPADFELHDQLNIMSLRENL